MIDIQISKNLYKSNLELLTPLLKVSIPTLTKLIETRTDDIHHVIVYKNKLNSQDFMTPQYMTKIECELSVDYRKTLVHKFLERNNNLRTNSLYIDKNFELVYCKEIVDSFIKQKYWKFNITYIIFKEYTHIDFENLIQLIS